METKTVGRGDISNPLFPEWVQTKLRAKAAKKAAVERALAKVKKAKDRAAFLAKMKSITNSGSSPIGPGEKAEGPTKVVTVELTVLERRIARALSQPQFRLTHRIAQRLELPEELIERVLSQVPDLKVKIDREKAAEEKRVREEYQGEVQKMRYNERHEAGARHDSRVRRRKPGMNSGGQAVKTMIQL